MSVAPASHPPTAAPLLLRAADDVPVLEMMGVRIRFLVPAAETGGAWSLLEYLAPPGFAGPAPHVHARTTELFHVLDGTLTLEVDGATHDLAAGGVAMVPPGVVHRFSNRAAEPCRILVHLTPGGMERYFTELAELVRTAPSWPLADMTPVAALGERFDSFAPPARER